MLRRFAEVASRRVVFKRRLPADFGNLPVIVSPDAQLKYWRPGRSAFDDELLAAAKRIVNPGDSVWDVGANIGVFSAAAAGRGAKRVIAVEADIWLASLIRRTSLLPEFQRLDFRVVPAAASNCAGVAEFSIAVRGRASNHLVAVAGSTQSGGQRAKVVVPTLPLDTLVCQFGAPSVIKIDVEGAEYMVLQGVKNTIEAYSPKIYCEVSSSNREGVDRLLGNTGYSPIWESGANVFYSK